MNQMQVEKKIYTPFGIAVKKRLLDKGISQTQLESMVGAPHNFLTAVLRGKRPGKKYIPLIATILEMDITKYAV